MPCFSIFINSIRSKSHLSSTSMLLSRKPTPKKAKQLRLFVINFYRKKEELELAFVENDMKLL